MVQKAIIFLLVCWTVSGEVSEDENKGIFNNPISRAFDNLKSQFTNMGFGKNWLGDKSLSLPVSQITETKEPRVETQYDKRTHNIRGHPRPSFEDGLKFIYPVLKIPNVIHSEQNQQPPQISKSTSVSQSSSPNLKAPNFRDNRPIMGTQYNTKSYNLPNHLGLRPDDSLKQRYPMTKTQNALPSGYSHSPPQVSKSTSVSKSSSSHNKPTEHLNSQHIVGTEFSKQNYDLPSHSSLGSNENRNQNYPVFKTHSSTPFEHDHEPPQVFKSTSVSTSNSQNYKPTNYLENQPNVEIQHDKSAYDPPSHSNVGYSEGLEQNNPVLKSQDIIPSIQTHSSPETPISIVYNSQHQNHKSSSYPKIRPTEAVQYLKEEYNLPDQGSNNDFKENYRIIKTQDFTPSIHIDVSQQALKNTPSYENKYSNYKSSDFTENGPAEAHSVIPYTEHSSQSLGTDLSKEVEMQQVYLIPIQDFPELNKNMVHLDQDQQRFLSAIKEDARSQKIVPSDSPKFNTAFVTTVQSKPKIQQIFSDYKPKGNDISKHAQIINHEMHQVPFSAVNKLKNQPKISEYENNEFPGNYILPKGSQDALKSILDQNPEMVLGPPQLLIIHDGKQLSTNRPSLHPAFHSLPELLDSPMRHHGAFPEVYSKHYDSRFNNQSPHDKKSFEQVPTSSLKGDYMEKGFEKGVVVIHHPPPKEKYTTHDESNSYVFNKPQKNPASTHADMHPVVKKYVKQEDVTEHRIPVTRLRTYHSVSPVSSRFHNTGSDIYWKIRKPSIDNGHQNGESDSNQLNEFPNFHAEASEEQEGTISEVNTEESQETKEQGSNSPQRAQNEHDNQNSQQKHFYSNLGKAYFQISRPDEFEDETSDDGNPDTQEDPQTKLVENISKRIGEKQDEISTATDKTN